VVKGDTLWDISAKFLKSPWRWPEIWGYNSQIADPHWIYPGDVISLIYVDGKPKLIIEKKKRQFKMAPHGRLVNKSQPIPTLPLADIRQYLTDSQIVATEQLDKLPLVVGSERATMFYKVGDIIYANQQLPVGGQYGIYSRDRRFSLPDSAELLGHELELTGVARVTVSAAISRLELLSTNAAVKKGQLIMELSENDTLPAYFLPQPAAKNVTSTILASGDRFREIGKYSVVIITGGTEQGIQEGSVFSVYHPGTVQIIDAKNQVRGPLELRRYDHIKAYFVDQEQVQLPEIYRGRLMVFRTFDKVSYALVTELASPMRQGDELISP
jgi:hypothetical protein